MPFNALHSRTRKSHSTEEARKRLIEAGLDLFGKYSFEGTSTRTVAQQAQVNVASIQYYFGSKDGLYLAVSHYIVEQVNELLGTRLAEIQKTLKQDLPSEERCLCLLCELVEFVITRFLRLPEIDKWLSIIVREQLCPTEAFGILFKGFLKPFYQTLFGLVARILGSESDDPDVKIRAFTIMGQVLMFHISPTSIKRTLRWKSYGPQNLDAVRRVILDNIQAVFSVSRNCRSTGSGASDVG
jgi:AcrR family transcriptional regulator